MSTDAIPDAVRKFLAEHVRSLMALELLLLLSRDPSGAWTAAELVRELRCTDAWAESELQSLTAGRLAIPIPEEPNRFRFVPQHGDAAEAVVWLKANYPERRFSVIQAIYAAPAPPAPPGPAGPAQSFADAFRLRKDNPNG